MIDEIDLESAGEHLGVIFPMAACPRYRVRVEIDMPEFLLLRGVYVPLGNYMNTPLFAYRRDDRETKMPSMPEHVSNYTVDAGKWIEPWLAELDLEGLVRPPTQLEYVQHLSEVAHRHAEKPYTEHWVPVTVRDADDPAREGNCAHPCWTNVLEQFAGLTGVLVHDTW